MIFIFYQSNTTHLKLDQKYEPESLLMSRLLLGVITIRLLLGLLGLTGLIALSLHLLAGVGLLEELERSFYIMTSTDVV